MSKHEILIFFMETVLVGFNLFVKPSILLLTRFSAIYNSSSQFFVIYDKTWLVLPAVHVRHLPIYVHS